MRPLPDLTNVPVMLARGRRAALWSARKEACEQLRDAATVLLHHETVIDVSHQASRAKAAIARIEEVADLMSADPQEFKDVPL